MKKPAHINKILEIDIDTDRKIELSVLQVASTERQRDRQPDTSWDDEDNLIILAGALITQVCSIEEKGLEKKGQTMKRIMEMLQAIYVDATYDVRDVKLNAQGNSVKKGTIMKISVIMPSYLGDYDGAAKNRAEKFKRAVNSFIDQQWPDSELIIVSDGCELTNQTLYGMNLAEPVPDHFLLDAMREIRLVKIAKHPPFSGAVRNAGIKNARGEVIGYLDTDDVLLSGHLGAIFQAFFKRPDAPGEYRCWVYFNDYVAGPNLEPAHERLAHLRSGGIGTGMFAHEKGLDVQWKDGYGHDWAFVQDLMQKYPHTQKVTGPRYLVCHIPPNIDV